MHSRLVVALQSNQPDAIFNELGDAARTDAAYTGFTQSVNEALAASGAIQSVQLVSPPVVKTDSPWDGNWAEAIVEIQWATDVERYLVIYYREGGRWWLFGTEPIVSSTTP